MASGQSIVVGGGIQAGTISLKQFLYVTNVNPPQASGSVTMTAEVDTGSSNLQYVSIPNSTGTHLTTTGATERLRVNGGALIVGSGTDSVQIGRGGVASASDSIASGRGSASSVIDAVVIGRSATNGGQTGVVLGSTAGMTSASGVSIGAGAAVSGNAGGASCVAIGTAAAAALPSNGGGTCIAIGTNAQARSEDVVIGGNASSNVQSTLGCGNVVIGTSATINKAQGFAVAIGWQAGSTQIGSVVIGAAASATAAAAQQKSIVIGVSSVATATHTIIIGSDASFTTTSIAIGGGAVDLGAGFCQLGAVSTPITTLLVGAGNTIATPAAKTIRFTNGTGTDNIAAAVTFIAPLSTGSGTPGTIIFQVGAVGGTGTTLQTATTVMTIGDQIVTFAGLISAANLPTSAGAAGTLWVDAGAANVVKRA